MTVMEIPKRLRRPGVIVTLDEEILVNALNADGDPINESAKKYPAQTPVILLEVPKQTINLWDTAKVLFPDGVVAWVNMFNMSPLQSDI
jgi:hypothetical protein